MEYENYAERIKPLFNFKSYKKLKADMKEVFRISVKKGERQLTRKQRLNSLSLTTKDVIFPTEYYPFLLNIYL